MSEKHECKTCKYEKLSICDDPCSYCRYPAGRWEPAEKTYTLADLEQARKQALDDAARTVLNWPLPTIQAPSMWLIDKHGIAADIRSLGPIGETREETERRVRRETVEAIELRMNNETPDNGDEYSWYQLGLLQGLDEGRAIVKSIITEGKHDGLS